MDNLKYDSSWYQRRDVQSSLDDREYPKKSSCVDKASVKSIIAKVGIMSCSSVDPPYLSLMESVGTQEPEA